MQLAPSPRAMGPRSAIGSPVRVLGKAMRAVDFGASQNTSENNNNIV